MRKLDVIARTCCAGWTLVIIVLISLGTFSTARIGTMTWGPQHDIWSAAIAISQIKFGLSGKLAFREVEQAIADEVTSTKSAWNVMDDATRALLQDPAAITRGLKKAAGLTKEEIVVPASDDGYISDWCEDLGYADFYNLAFRLFGFNAYSTHFLYVAILVLTVLVFQMAFFRDHVALVVLTLSVTALFLLSTTVIFSELLPSFAANRFLSTLGLVPLLHLLCASLRREALKRLEVAAVALQTLILTSAIAFRGSASWLVFALGSFLVVLIAVRRNPGWRTIFGAAREFVRGAIGRRLAWNKFAQTYNFIALNAALTTGVIAFSVIALAGMIRSAQVSERYFRDDNLPHHLIWHSAYVGLTLHPDWPTFKPYNDVPDGGDGAGFLVFEHKMKERGESPLSLTPELYATYYRARTYERTIRNEYFLFLAKHPTYALQLFFYYKPLSSKEILATIVSSIPFRAAMLALVSVLLGCLLLALSLNSPAFRGLELGGMVVFVWLWSLLPVFWAYPAGHVISDPAWATLLMLLAIPCTLFALVVQGSVILLGGRPVAKGV